MDKFWIVARMDEHATRPMAHTSFTDAKQEAVRLSQQHKGERFLVYECVGHAETSFPTKWTKAEVRKEF